MIIEYVEYYAYIDCVLVSTIRSLTDFDLV